MGAFLGMGFIALFFILFAALILPMVFYLLTLQRALQKCAPGNRSQSPGLVWLEIIPFFGFIWQFVNVLAISKSLGGELRARRIPADPAPAQSIGLAMCITAVCTVIPFVGTFLALAHLVLFIIYWVKVAEFSRQLDLTQPPAPYTPVYSLTGVDYQYRSAAHDQSYLSGGPEPQPVGASPGGVWAQCPLCSAPAVPGERFCKSCGSELS
jgi:hypothetical protein